MKTKCGSIIFVIVGVVLIGSAGCSFGSQEGEGLDIAGTMDETVTENLPSLESIKFLSYHSEDGFAISYPEGWSLDEAPEGGPYNVAFVEPESRAILYVTLLEDFRGTTADGRKEIGQEMVEGFKHSDYEILADELLEGEVVVSYIAAGILHGPYGVDFVFSDFSSIGAFGRGYDLNWKIVRNQEVAEALSPILEEMIRGFSWDNDCSFFTPCEE